MQKLHDKIDQEHRAWLIMQQNLTYLKGISSCKKSYTQMKAHEQCKKNEPSPTSMHQIVLEIIHFKVRNLGKMDIANL